MMNDVERRLALGRTGKQVRDQEQAIVEKLDKLIDQLEQQQQQQQKQRQQQQQQQRQQQKQQQQQQQAADDSMPGGGDGQGAVDDKDIGDKSGWGNLPPAARQEALQSMTKDLPSHYREVIEAYFKRLSKTPDK
jgi:TolA-binding protein